MGRAIPYDFRRKIVRERLEGKSFEEIAANLGFPATARGVRKVYSRHETRGEEGLQTDFKKNGRKAQYTDEEMWAAIEALRAGRQRGANYIFSLRCSQGEPTPSERTMQRKWKALGTNRSKGGVKKRENVLAQKPHEVWEADGKEQMKMATGEEVTWMNVADKASGADLFAELFPPE
ncbi:MAG: hypothetical protein IPH12_02510 [Saprospirales bacterium]|jgi:hypothetical protein|nr:hypothetical protein [Saprospirales bacterium]MBK8921484.1 hypothetical protein [Saprospirales bacterium]